MLDRQREIAWFMYLIAVLPTVTILGWTGSAWMLTEPNSFLNVIAIFCVALLILHALVALRLGLVPTYRFLKRMLTMKFTAPLLALCALLASCTKVEPGYVGIKVNQYGDQKGVEDFPLFTGRVTYNPFTTDIYRYPTFRQSVIWDADTVNDSGTSDNADESVTFNSVEGAVINADLAASYSLKAEMVPAMFVEFRKPIDEVTDIYVRSEARDSLARHAGTMKVVDIFGTRKQELLEAVEKDLNGRLGPHGFLFEMISFVGALRCERNVMESINATIEATQLAISARNKVVQSQAEADQAIETARGQAESILAVATAQAKANKLVAESLTDELVQWRAIEKWDGVQPQFMGGGNGVVPMFNMGSK